MNAQPPTDTDLDAFETALLADLKSEVERNADARQQEVVPLTSPVAHRRRRWYLPSAAAVAAAAAVAVTVTTNLPTPAYAVSQRMTGEVTVEVNRLEGERGLEEALLEHGVTADVTYLPEGETCAPGRYDVVDTPGLTLGVSAERFEVTIPPNAVGPGDTFVLSAAVVPQPDGGVSASVSFDIAQGPIAPCRVIDAA
ncbi:hypothetical protein WDZ17_13710 [Pseudokineococcus basanitobsidens]|uniref:Uncharacterized protein n=1 Tax=Pseudokineococcus basanitobsidens TaxID=1926649 RepID=A0ABU8RMQ8_9ACTN